MKEVTVEIIKKDMKIPFDMGMNAGILESCIKVTTEAKSLAPFDEGRLRNSIMWKTSQHTGGFNDSSSDEKADKELTVKPKKAEGFVGCNLEYAVYQEFGTRYMAPQPFLRPALLLIQKGDLQDVIKRIKEETERGILKEGQKRETFR